MPNPHTSNIAEQAQALIRHRIVVAHHAGDWRTERFALAMAHLFYDDISEYPSNEVKDYLLAQRLGRVTLFDHPHDSDEECSIEILLQDDKPIAAWKRIGDHYEYYDGLLILDKIPCERLATHIRNLNLAQMQPIAEAPHDFVAWCFEGNQYLHQVTGVPEELLAYSLASPEYALGNLNLCEEKVFVVEGSAEKQTATGVTMLGGTLVEVEQLVEVHRPRVRWSDEKMRTTVFLRDGRTMDVSTAALVIVPRHT